MSSFSLHWPAFLIAFAIGISYVYFVNPPPKVVIKYPNPYNSGKITYQGNDDMCYKYNAKKVQCPKEGGIPQPISSS